MVCQVEHDKRLRDMQVAQSPPGSQRDLTKTAGSTFAQPVDIGAGGGLRARHAERALKADRMHPVHHDQCLDPVRRGECGGIGDSGPQSCPTSVIRSCPVCSITANRLAGEVGPRFGALRECPWSR